MTCDTTAELLGFASSQESVSRSLRRSDWLLCFCIFYFISYLNRHNEPLCATSISLSTQIPAVLIFIPRSFDSRGRLWLFYLLL